LAKDILLGVLAIFSRYSLLGFIEDLIETFSPEKLPIGGIYQMENKNLEKGSISPEQPKKGSEQTDSKEISETPEISEKIQRDLFIADLTDFLQDFRGFNDKAIKALKKASETDFFYEDKPEIQEAFISLLQAQSGYLTKSYSMRSIWITMFGHYLSEDVRLELKDLETNREKITENYLLKTDKLAERTNIKSSLKEFFTITNAYRNALNKELNKAEEMVHKNLRETVVYKNPGVKKLVNIDYPNIKQSFNKEDNYLKNKIQERLHSKGN
jgi:hypothetical protein